MRFKIILFENLKLHESDMYYIYVLNVLGKT
jgi:hypothetical protein